jgi:tyrosyl-tRNA synthetase
MEERYGIRDLPAFRLINNHEFYKDMSVVTFLREVGVHFRLASMLSRESVKQRLDSGMSFTEFSYQLF